MAAQDTAGGGESKRPEKSVEEIAVGAVVRELHEYQRSIDEALGDIRVGIQQQSGHAPDYLVDEGHDLDRADVETAAAKTSILAEYLNEEVAPLLDEIRSTSENTTDDE